ATKLDWLPAIEKEYGVSGGGFYQARKYKNGNYVFKYLGGVSLLELPFFLLGHLLAKALAFPADGFSPPYQYSLAFGVIFYNILSLFLLRFLLLRYFKDSCVAIGLGLLYLATNLLQYISVNGSLSHAFILPLYVLVIYTTMQWHERPSLKWAFLTGLIIGLATICRPTEAIMLFIPLLWDTHTKEAARIKWAKVSNHIKQVGAIILGGFLGVLPQLIYWKSVTGSLVYNVGSKWQFLNPNFQVLYGFTNGWFIYTPITIFFVLGLWHIKRFPFRRAFITFCLLNIWIITAWSDWRYGASFSTRALVQSYPVFAFPFIALIEQIDHTKFRIGFYILGLYLIGLNLFQTWQYNTGVLHYRDMNLRYYSHIYLNPTPTALDMSLLDTDEYLYHPESFTKRILFKQKEELAVDLPRDSIGIIWQGIPSDIAVSNTDQWLKITAEILPEKGYYGAHLICTTNGKDGSKQRSVRLNHPLAETGQVNQYAFYFKLPSEGQLQDIRLTLQSPSAFQGVLKKGEVVLLY
ncbi:MAG: hypothetical protein AAGH79_16615, partial [Bacteroidota bacterium]